MSLRSRRPKRPLPSWRKPNVPVDPQAVFHRIAFTRPPCQSATVEPLLSAPPTRTESSENLPKLQSCCAFLVTGVSRALKRPQQWFLDAVSTRWSMRKDARRRKAPDVTDEEVRVESGRIRRSRLNDLGARALRLQLRASLFCRCAVWSVPSPFRKGQGPHSSIAMTLKHVTSPFPQTHPYLRCNIRNSENDVQSLTPVQASSYRQRSATNESH